MLSIANKEHQINEEITDKEIRLIDADGSQLGVVTVAQALSIAAERELDLVKIAPQAVPPVCKVMDYGKYLFDKTKHEKEQKKNQKKVDIKEIKLSLGIADNDFNTKVKHAFRFFKEGDKVKVSIRFRGREMGHPELGLEVMQRFADACAEVGTVEKPAKLEGRQMLMFLVPKVNK